VSAVVLSSLFCSQCRNFLVILVFVFHRSMINDGTIYMCVQGRTSCPGYVIWHIQVHGWLQHDTVFVSVLGLLGKVFPTGFIYDLKMC
jgi:hypothetical protein